MFWICAENRVVNTDFSLLLSRAYTVFSSHHTSPVRGAQGAEGGQSQDSWPQMAKGMFLSIWCHAQHVKLRGMKKGGGGRSICLPKQSLCVMEPCSPDNHLPMGRGEGIPYFALLALRAFALAIKLSSFQPPSFLTFALLVLSVIWPGGVSSSVVPCCQLGLNHKSNKHVRVDRATGNLL